MMKPSTDIGMNRTGMGTSPRESDRMMDNTRVGPAVTPGGAGSIAKLRGELIEVSPPIGNVPPPSTAKGAAKAALELLKGKSPTVLLNKLGERLAYERTGARLYDALVVKLEKAGEENVRSALPMARKFRDDEVHHFETVWQAIETLGGDPTVQTPAADVAGVHSHGLMQMLTDTRTTPLESLDTILKAELGDHEGWSMLVDLAEQAGQKDMVEKFRVALRDEEVHLAQARSWVRDLMRQELS